MTNAEPHKWEFKARFRRHAFGWKSQPAIRRVKEAVAEIINRRMMGAIMDPFIGRRSGMEGSFLPSPAVVSPPSRPPSTPPPHHPPSPPIDVTLAFSNVADGAR